MLQLQVTEAFSPLTSPSVLGQALYLHRSDRRQIGKSMNHDNYPDNYIRGIQRMSLDRVTMAGGANSAATKSSHEDDGGQ